jgi:hypothetical protein
MASILEGILRRVEAEIPDSTTIILGGLNFFSDADHINDIFDKAKKFENKDGSGS